MDAKTFFIMTCAALAAQFVLFIPFFLVWRKDCKEIGKDNLAVSLRERFVAWVLWCPIWLFPVLALTK